MQFIRQHAFTKVEEERVLQLVQGALLLFSTGSSAKVFGHSEKWDHHYFKSDTFCVCVCATSENNHGSGLVTPFKFSKNCGPVAVLPWGTMSNSICFKLVRLLSWKNLCELLIKATFLFCFPAAIFVSFMENSLWLLQSCQTLHFRVKCLNMDTQSRIHAHLWLCISHHPPQLPEGGWLFMCFSVHMKPLQSD